MYFLPRLDFRKPKRKKRGIHHTYMMASYDHLYTSGLKIQMLDLQNLHIIGHSQD